MFIGLFLLFKWPYVFPNYQLEISGSSYLNQHKHDFVNWNEWGQETLLKAQHENKLVFISIGFATCYWCHYMQKDSFKNIFLGFFLNQNFVPILIDKEQLPEINQIYMNSIIFEHGYGGWPLTIIATPTGVPLFLGTTMQQNELKDILKMFHNDWIKNRDSLIHQSQDWLTRYVNYNNRNVILMNDYVSDLRKWLSKNIDPLMGGFKGVQKFPNASRWTQLLDIDSSQIIHAEALMNSIMTSPLYDVVDGGIHRYSSDKTWSIPHFEKLLIDQVNFMDLLLTLNDITSEPIYLDIVKDTLIFVHDKLRNDNELFITGLDAGTVGHQGEYYYVNQKIIDLKLIGFDFIQLTESEGLVSLRSIEDFQKVDRSLLKKYRKDFKEMPQKDLYVSIATNSKLMEIINRYQNVSGDRLFAQSIQLIQSFLIDQLNEDLKLNDLLVIYDSFSKIGYKKDLNLIKDKITAHLILNFPYYKHLDYLPVELAKDSYKDTYDSPQKLYYILKYFLTETSNNYDHDYCGKLTNIIYDTWEQLSLVKFFHNNCD